MINSVSDPLVKISSKHTQSQTGKARHIVPSEKFHRIGGAPPKTFPNVKYDAPEEVGGDRKCFDSPIRK